MQKFSLMAVTMLLTFAPAAAFACGGGLYDPYESVMTVRGQYVTVRRFSRRILNGQVKAPMSSYDDLTSNGDR